MGVQTGRSAVQTAFRGSASLESSIKRSFDVFIVSLALLFLLPLIACLALVIVLTQGRPIIYRQTRLGMNGRTFQCLKFRSMVQNADVVLRDHLAENPQAAREWAERQKLSKDPRITRFGLFLRKSSFDELPQLFNILGGDMSLVGPRPIIPDEVTKYGERASQLISVRPGLTGLWQVSGRSQVSYETRIRMDMDYIQNWTLKGDIIIIAKTIPAVLLQRGSM